MAYAGDRLYNEVIRKKMGDLATRVRVREIVAFLPCLTLSDREEIEAKRETAGNYSAMILLLDNLRRRENWPDQFIMALQSCEQWSLADELSEAYDNIRGINTQRTTAAASASTAAAPVSLAAPPAPVSAPAPAPAPAAAAPSPAPSPAAASANVTTATIHSVPHSTPPLLTPSVEASAVSDSSSAEVSAPVAPVHPPPESALPAKPPLPDFQTSKLGPSAAPAPLHSPPQSCSNIASPALMENAVEPPREPALPPLLETPSVGQSEVPVGSRGTPTLCVSSGLTSTAFSVPSSVGVSTLPTNPTSTSSQVNKPATTSQSSALPEKNKVPVAVVGSSSSVKNPIQETNPPGTVLPQDSKNNPAISQTWEMSQGPGMASPSRSTDAAAGCLSNSAAVNKMYFSKPGVLREEEPFSASSDCLQISHMTMGRPPVHPARPQAVPNALPVDRPVSVTTDDLMISSSSSTVRSQHVSDPIAPVQNSTLRSLENDFPESDSNSYPHQPVEDFYESGLGTEMHIVEVSEGPSVQKLNSQPPSMVGQTTKGLRTCNGETENLFQSVSEDLSQHSQGITQRIQGSADSEQGNPVAAALTTYTEPGLATFQESELDASGQINIPQSEQKERSQGVLQRFRSNPYFIAAAAIGMTAAFMAFKHKY